MSAFGSGNNSTKYVDIPGTVTSAGNLASITTTTLYTPSTSEQYEVTCSVRVTTAGSVGTLAVTIGWTDENGAQTQSPISALTLTATGKDGFIFPFFAVSGNAITYAVTLTGVVGSPAYSLSISLKRLN